VLDQAQQSFRGVLAEHKLKRKGSRSEVLQHLPVLLDLIYQGLLCLRLEFKVLPLKRYRELPILHGLSEKTLNNVVLLHADPSDHVRL
jgi:hypothetical protein